MRPPLRSRLGGLALWLGAGSALGIGCDGPEPRDLRLAAAPSVVDDEDTTTGPELALVQAGEPAMAPDAELPSPQGLEPLERRRFRDAVAEGHRLHGAHDYEGALAAYARALDLVPGDPRTLSDQGWAALFAGRLDEAEAALRQAEAAAGDEEPRLRASILYNRGRVAEARGDATEAIDAYQRSLRLRPHAATYQHLTALAGGTRYQFGPEVRRLQGPYAKLNELCHEERVLSEAAGEGDDVEPFACLPDAAKGLYADAVDLPADRGLPAPWKALRFVETRPSGWSARLHAALRTDDGWFVLPDVATIVRGTAGTTESVTRLSAQVEPLLAGGWPEVVLEVETRWVVTEEGVELESETHRVEFLCGVGPSGIPACTGALPRATMARRHEPGEGESTRWTVERRTTPEGLVVLEGDRDALDEPAAAVLGAHRIAFP
jgi:tetratricopeptide (TPR) repeat protein